MAANRPEIKIYPAYTVGYDPDPHWDQATGNPAAHAYGRQERSGRHPDEDRYLRGLVGKSVTVHTVSTGQLQGVLVAVLSDAILIRTERGQLLIHDWAIAAIQSE